MPLDYLLALLRDNAQTQEVRTDAAKAAAPYLHARLAAVEHSGEIVTAYVSRLPNPIPDIDEWQRQSRETLQ